jgi:predicted RNase H-like nuclease (RuvC/YqgF family)
MENLILFWRKIEEFCGFEDGEQPVYNTKQEQLENKLSDYTELITKTVSEMNCLIKKNVAMKHTIEELKQKNELLQKEIEQKMYEYMKLEYDYENNRHFE